MTKFLISGEPPVPVEVGIGNIEYFTYAMRITNMQGEQIWDGIINGKPAIGPGGVKGISPANPPSSLTRALQSLQGQQYHAEWTPVWEEVNDE